MRQQPSHRGAFASSDDYTILSLAVILVGLAFGGWLLWRFEHGEISAAVMRLARWQMRFIHLFTDRYDLADAQVGAADPEGVSFPALVRLCDDIGRFFLVPAVLFVLALASLCFLRAAPARFCREFDLDGLIREQARSYHSIAAFVRRTLRLVRPRDGEPRPLDPALNPREWIARWATDARGDFDEARARAELDRQLGPLWRGLAQAEPHVRCMLAVFALHWARRSDDALALLGDLSESLALAPGEREAGPERPLAFPAAVVATADAYLRDQETVRPALNCAARHGYTAPALMSVLTEARRRSGVLAPAQFAWLKLVDRRLWYALHSLGFPSDGSGKDLHPNPRVEAVGARDHWAAECIAGRPILTAMVDRALAAIRATAADPRRQPNEQEGAR